MSWITMGSWVLQNVYSTRYLFTVLGEITVEHKESARCFGSKAEAEDVADFLRDPDAWIPIERMQVNERA